MNQALVDQIVQAVLYEGYILYPYRPSVKNRQRWTFGGLVPQAYSQAQGGTENWIVHTECLVHGNAGTTLTVRVRFLHLLARLVGELAQPLSELPAGAEPTFRVVEAVQVGEKLYQTWQEAVEREFSPGEMDLDKLIGQLRQHRFSFPAHRDLEPLRSSGGEIRYVLVRDQQSVEGAVELTAERIGDELFKVRVVVRNHTPLENAQQKSRNEALMRSLVSTHTILGVRAGEFISLLDPPERWRGLAAGCRNEGTWPVLVGDPGEKDTMLSSPIILYDYPQIAPESPGDLFDSTEIDELLTLRILTLTEEEKQAMAAVDERARALLRRTEALANKQFLGLHGVVRGLRPLPAEDYHDVLGPVP
jgi:hydrogenase maturation protease